MYNKLDNFSQNENFEFEFPTVFCPGKLKTNIYGFRTRNSIALHICRPKNYKNKNLIKITLCYIMLFRFFFEFLSDRISYKKNNSNNNIEPSSPSHQFLFQPTLIGKVCHFLFVRFRFFIGCCKRVKVKSFADFMRHREETYMMCYYKIDNRNVEINDRIIY